MSGKRFLELQAVLETASGKWPIFITAPCEGAGFGVQYYQRTGDLSFRKVSFADN